MEAEMGAAETARESGLGDRVEQSRREHATGLGHGAIAAWLKALSTAERVAYGATVVYALVFTAFAILRHLAYQSQMVDLATMTQAIWNTAHGHFLEITTTMGQMSRLGIHVDPFLTLLTPLWWLWPSPLLLVSLQALAVSAGALPVFWLARKHLGSERAAAFFALAYLLYPATQFVAFEPATGFHANTIGVPLVLFAIWFLDEDRLVAFAIVALIAATTKEEMPLVVGLLGIWYAASHRRWRIGLSIFAVGLAISLFNFLYVLPHFGGGGYTFGDRYSAVGGSPGGIIRTAITDPIAIVHDVSTVRKLVYVLLLFAPFFGLWLLEPLLLLGAVPDLAIDLLSNYPGQNSIVYNDTAGMIPFIVAASILGLARWKRARNQAPRIALYLLAVVATIAVYSPLVGGSHDLAQALPSNPIHRAKVAALSLIPSNAAVAASNQLGAHLADRRRLMLFPFIIKPAQWIVVDENDSTYAVRPYRRRIDLVRRNPDWRLVYSSHGILVFRKVGGTRPAGA
jgi:uncharacterized membrane protein